MPERMAQERTNENVQVQLAGTQAQVDALASNVASLVISVEKLRTVISDGLDRQRDRNRFDWGPMAAWLGIVLTVLGVIGTITIGAIMRDLDRHERWMERQQAHIEGLRP